LYNNAAANTILPTPEPISQNTSFSTLIPHYVNILINDLIDPKVIHAYAGEELFFVTYGSFSN